MGRWDDRERRRDWWGKRQERIGRYMFVGSSSILVVYLGTDFWNCILDLKT